MQLKSIKLINFRQFKDLKVSFENEENFQDVSRNDEETQKMEIFGNEDVEAVTERNGKSVAQVALRWSLQKGFLPLPKSVTPKNIECNLDIFDFDLSEEDMAVLDKIQGIKTQDDPDTVNF